MMKTWIKSNEQQPSVSCAWLTAVEVSVLPSAGEEWSNFLLKTCDAGFSPISRGHFTTSFHLWWVFTIMLFAEFLLKQIIWAVIWNALNDCALKSCRSKLDPQRHINEVYQTLAAHFFTFTGTHSEHNTNQTSLWRTYSTQFIYRVFEEPCMQMYWNYRQNSSSPSLHMGSWLTRVNLSILLI